MNKKYLIYSIIGVIVLIIGATVITIINNNKKADLLNYVKEYGYDKPISVIKSTTSKPIEKDGVEATQLELYKLDNSLKVITTLKNNTDNEINGFFIQLALLDKNGNVVFPMAVNSGEKIMPGKTLTIENYATIDNKTKVIVDAKIESINIVSSTLNELQTSE